MGVGDWPSAVIVLMLLESVVVHIANCDFHTPLCVFVCVCVCVCVLYLLFIYTYIWAYLLHLLTELSSFPLTKLTYYPKACLITST